MAPEPVRKIRKTAIGTNVALLCLIALAIIVMVNYLSFRHYRRFDWTMSRYYSLSDKTVNVLEGLRLPIKVYVFYQPMTPIAGDIKELLNRYSDVSRKIEVEFVDPVKDPARTEFLFNKFKIPARRDANLVVFEQGDKNKYVYDKDIVEMDYGGMRGRRPPRIKAFKGEQAFTSAIISLTAGEQPVVYFVTGHGERDFEDTGRTGLQICETVLERENLKVEKLALYEKKEVPDDCSLLMIIGPREPYTDKEKSAVERYLNRGKRLFVALDPQTNSGLESLLRKWDVEVGDNIVVDPASAQRLLFFSALNLFAEKFPEPSITGDMENRATLFAGVRSVSPGNRDPELRAVSIVRTSDSGWGEINVSDETFRFDEDEDLKGPISLSVAVEAVPDKVGDKQLKNVRIVVMGDSVFLSNGQIATAANASFFLNVVNWLTSRENLIAIGPKMPEQIRVRLNAAQMNQIFWVALVGLPGLSLLVGFVVWWRRRR